jgi:hypothetical protein
MQPVTPNLDPFQDTRDESPAWVVLVVLVAIATAFIVLAMVLGGSDNDAGGADVTTSVPESVAPGLG